MPKSCPQCRLVNPPEAAVCDCGYEFATSRPIRPFPAYRDAVMETVALALASSCLVLMATAACPPLLLMSILFVPRPESDPGASFVWAAAELAAATMAVSGLSAVATWRLGPAVRRAAALSPAAVYVTGSVLFDVWFFRTFS